MATTIDDSPELHHLLHELREPVGAFAIRLSMLDDEEMSTAAQAHLKSMHENVQRMTVALDALNFALDNGHFPPQRPSPRRASRR